MFSNKDMRHRTNIIMIIFQCPFSSNLSTATIKTNNDDKDNNKNNNQDNTNDLKRRGTTTIFNQIPIEKIAFDTGISSIHFQYLSSIPRVVVSSRSGFSKERNSRMDCLPDHHHLQPIQSHKNCCRLLKHAHVSNYLSITYRQTLYKAT